MPDNATAPSPSARYEASLKFVGELGALPPEIQQEVVSLIHRVTTNPYDPEIVRKVSSISEDNLYFRWTLGNGDTMFWKVETPAKLSVTRVDDLTVIFLAIRKNKT